MASSATPKKLRDGFHGQEESIFNFRQLNKTVFSVERAVEKKNGAGPSA